MTPWLRPALLLVVAVLPLSSHADEGSVAASEAIEASAAIPLASLERSSLAQRLELAWARPRATLEERLTGIQQQLGVIGFEPVALALLHEGGAADALERTRLAAATAPDLPAAHAAHASALLSTGSLLDAAHAALHSLRALLAHFDSRVWLDLTALELGERTLLWGGILFLGVLAAFAAPRAAHDLGDLAVGASQGSRERTDMPGFARAALLATLLLLPFALGEGGVGAVLVLFGLAMAYGDGARRLTAVCAVVMMLVALHPLAGHRQRVLARVAADPVPAAVYAALHSVPAAQDLALLGRAALDRPAAAFALALSETRAGRAAEAEALLAPHLEDSSDPALLTLAGNLSMLRGDSAGAIALYERAVEIAPSAVTLFNLSQAHGQAIHLGQQEAVLARAQALDAEAVTRLVAEQTGPPRGVVDLAAGTPDPGAGAPAPLPTPPAPSRLAPGYLGDARLGAVLFPVVGLLACVAPRFYRRSRSCTRCGARRCPRCDRPGGGTELCAPCARLVHSPETTDPGLRVARLEELRRRQQRLGRLHVATSLLVPGTAGLLAGRPLQGLAGASAFALVLALARAPGWMPPDPGSVGGAAILLFASGAGAAALVYLGGLATGLRARGGD